MAERLRESRVKWFLCDADLHPKAEQAVKSVPWPVDIITLGDVQDCVSAQDLIDDDGTGTVHGIFKLPRLPHSKYSA